MMAFGSYECQFYASLSKLFRNVPWQFAEKPGQSLNDGGREWLEKDAWQIWDCSLGID